MISKETNDTHRKHAKLSRPDTGMFGRNEVAILGTTCDNIRKLAYNIIKTLSPSHKIAYIDADHKSANEAETNNSTALANGAFLEYTDKIAFQRFDFKNNLNTFQKQLLFNEQDLIIVNGNHFSARQQIVVVDPVKNLEKKREKLTDVRLILLKDKDQNVPAFLQNMPALGQVPILLADDERGIPEFVKRLISEKEPALQGLVLSGGQSSRMQKDKGNLNYHGVSQREYLFGLLSKYCQKTFISCNAQQATELAGRFPVIQDSFLNLGPMGGILSALQSNSNAAWITIACDLPFLSEKTIEFLVRNRNSSKTATAFLDPQGEFPEPLITIWEPKSYPVLLQFLGLGYSCPRKALINADIELLKAPDPREFVNANSPDEYENALQGLKTK